MFCPKCGQEVSGDADKCYSCGEPLNNPQAPRQPDAGAPAEPVQNNLVWAILTTIFCCLPFGIVAIVYAAQVDGKTASGDHAGALEASKKAKTWSFVAFLCGLIPMVLYAILMIIGLVAGAIAEQPPAPPAPFNNF
ncbi:MAG: CD225/dispanin family protein [Planctomycetes bacterium]|nr:CD225/dispanin family protein [Planctomycetota bacterium]